MHLLAVVEAVSVRVRISGVGAGIGRRYVVPCIRLEPVLDPVSIAVDELGCAGQPGAGRVFGAVDQIRTSTDSLSEMFTTLLDLSRLDAGAARV